MAAVAIGSAMGSSGVAVLAGLGLLGVVVDRVGVDVLLAAAQRVGALGDDVHLEVGAGDSRLLPRSGVLGGLLRCLQGGVLSRACDLLRVRSRDGMALAGGLHGRGLGR